jgi:hypothetical protein
MLNSILIIIISVWKIPHQKFIQHANCLKLSIIGGMAWAWGVCRESGSTVVQLLHTLRPTVFQLTND